MPDLNPYFRMYNQALNRAGDATEYEEVTMMALGAIMFELMRTSKALEDISAQLAELNQAQQRHDNF